MAALHISRRQVDVATIFCTVTPDICGPSVCNVLHVTALAPRILRWFLIFGKFFVTLHYVIWISGDVVYEAYLFV